MSASGVPKNAYTDAPELHTNFLLGGLQVLFWLFFHPSAWRNHLSRIDPTLSPNLTPLELSWAKLRNPSLRRLILILAILPPLLTGLISGTMLWISGEPGSVVLAGTLTCVALAGFGFLVSALGIGLPAGLTIGLNGVIPVLTFIWVAWPNLSAATIMPVAIASGATYSVVGQVVGSLTEPGPRRPIMQQVGGCVLGLVMGAIGVGLVVLAAFDLANAAAVGLLDGALTGLALGVAVWIERNPRRAIASGITVGAIAGLFGSATFHMAEGQIGVFSEDVLRSGLAIAVIAGVGAVAAGSLRNWRLNLITGLLVGTALVAVLGIFIFGLISQLPSDVVKTLQFAGFFATVLFALFYVLTSRIGGVWAGILSGAMSCAGGWMASLIMVWGTPVWPALPLSLLGILVGLTFIWWRPLLYPFFAAWNTLLYRLDQNRSSDHPSLLRFNSAFWDEHQRLPLAGLEDHLVLAAERNPAEGQAAIHYLTTTRQRWAAQSAQIEMEARRMERCSQVWETAQIYHHLEEEELSGPASALFGRFSRLSQDLNAALNQEGIYHQRLLLRNVLDRLSSLLNELTRSSESYAARFYPIASHWHQLVDSYLHELAEAVEGKEQIDNPYIFGVPLTERNQIFVGRTDVAARIEQLLLDQRRPPLLLYGQRRMGKTSLLRNLGRLLPSTILPIFVDGEGISGAADYADLLYCIAREMTKSAERQSHLLLPALQRQTLAPSPFTIFGEWLDQVERILESRGDKIALLLLDEFEALDHVLSRGRFGEHDFLRLLRHLIQHRPRFKVLLAGSHLFDEYQRWSSYLVNVQVVKISYLQEADALQLIERPIKGFALDYEPGASQRVLQLTRGHPHLLQLLCYELVEHKNSQPALERRMVRLQDVEAATSKALDTGKFFFIDIEHNQVGDRGGAVLRFMAEQGGNALVSREVLVQNFPQGLEPVLELLLQRDLIQAQEDGYRFQVELIRRWFEPRP